MTALASKPSRPPKVPYTLKPVPPTVELARVSVDESELLGHRALVDTVAALEFPSPSARFAGREPRKWKQIREAVL